MRCGHERWGLGSRRGLALSAVMMMAACARMPVPSSAHPAEREGPSSTENPSAGHIADTQGRAASPAPPGSDIGWAHGLFATPDDRPGRGGGTSAAPISGSAASTRFNAMMTIICMDQEGHELSRWAGPVRWAGTPSHTPVTYLGTNYNGAVVWVSEPPAAGSIMVGMAPGDSGGSGGSGGTPIKHWIHPGTHRIRMTVQGMSPAPALNIPPAASPTDVLVVRVEMTQPYIDQAATYVAYDGLDNVFIIDWRADGKSGQVRVPHGLVTNLKYTADVLEDTTAGVSVPAHYTPLMVPRLWPLMQAAREKWAREFDEMAFASTGMLVTATVLTLRPITAPVVGSALAPALANTAHTRAGLAQARTPAAGMTRLQLLQQVRAAAQSADPAVRLEGLVAQRFRNRLVSFQRKVSMGGRIVGEIDVELSDAIIEVTTGTGRGKVAQVGRLMSIAVNPSGKSVVVFGPDISAGRIPGLEAAGARVARSLEELSVIVGGS